MPWQSSAIDPNATTPGDDIGKITNDLELLRSVIGGGTDPDVPNAAQAIPAGAIMAFAMQTPPAGWLECDGSAISRAGNPALFAAIGTTYGDGDGVTTFNLPDARSEFLRGWDHGRGVDAGRAFGSWQADDLEAHTHSVAIYDPDEDEVVTIGGARPEGDPGSVSTGSTGGAETRPRNLAILYCIKT